MTIARYVVVFDREIGLQDGQAHGQHDGTGQDAVRLFTEDLKGALELDGEIMGVDTFRVIQRAIIDPEHDSAVLLPGFEDDPLSLPNVPRSGEGEQVDPW